MSDQLTISIDDGGLARAMTEVVDRVSHPLDILDAVGNDLETLVRFGFMEGEDPYGTPWAPLSPATRQGHPLRDTDNLMNKITHAVGSDYVDIGTDVCYVLVHQFGATITAGQPTGNNVCGYQPKGAKALRWKSRNGSWHSAKSVTIPARPIFPNAGQGLPNSWRQTIMKTLAPYMLPGHGTKQ